MIQVDIPLNIANILKYLIVYLFSFTVVHDLVAFASYLDSKRTLRRGGDLRFASTRRTRVFSVSYPGIYGFLIVVLAQISFLSVEYSVSEITVYKTVKLPAITYTRNNNPFNYSDLNLTRAAAICHTEYHNSSATSRAPVFFLHKIQEFENETRFGSSFSRNVNGSVASCVGTRPGETVPVNDTDTLTFQALSDNRCNEGVNVASRVINNITICFKQGNRTYIEAAFDITEKNRPKGVAPYFYLTDIALPSTFWIFSSIGEREYITDEQPRIRIGPTSLFLLFLLLLYLVSRLYLITCSKTELPDLHHIILAFLRNEYQKTMAECSICQSAIKDREQYQFMMFNTRYYLYLQETKRKTGKIYVSLKQPRQFCEECLEREKEMPTDYN